MKNIIWILLLLALIACDETTPIPNEKPVAETTQDSLPDTPAMADAAPSEGTQKTTLEYYDEAKALTKKWNEAIASKDYAALQTMYAPEATLYGKEKQLEEIIASKKKWLDEHSDYNQLVEDKIKAQELSLSLDGKDLYRTIFTKVTVIDQQKKQHQAILDFVVQEDGKLQIVAETDLATILVNAKKATGKTLQDGRYKGINEVWEDSRDPVFSHKTARLTWQIDLVIQDGQVQPKGEIDYYSGYARMFSTYFVMSGNYADNILELNVALQDIAELESFEELKSHKTQTIRIKTLDGTWVVLDNPVIPTGTVIYMQQ